MEGSTPTSNVPEWISYVSLGLGIIGLCAWLIPIAGCPVAIGGIITGVVGLKTEQRTFAIIGIVLSSLIFIASLINAIAGAALFASGGFNF